MKNKLFSQLLLISLLIVNVSCDTDDASNSQNIKAYNTSLETWEHLKLISGASYVYEISTTSFSGYKSTTQITVQNDIVVSRTYESYSIYDENNTYLGYENRLITSSYTESSETLGTNTDGASPLTIDELYDTCLSDYLSIDPDTNTITFNVNDFNIISDCYYIPDGCQDDCTFGITITNFQWLDSN
ncbi:hypothetical protein [Yeosuana marina]|uniref:hypothetical protein n=1 Tax=Yeosuana marina TaxID=1565536 RepID=UPI0030C83BAB